IRDQDWNAFRPWERPWSVEAALEASRATGNTTLRYPPHSRDHLANAGCKPGLGLRAARTHRCENHEGGLCSRTTRSSQPDGRRDGAGSCGTEGEQVNAGVVFYALVLLSAALLLRLWVRVVRNSNAP